MNFGLALKWTNRHGVSGALLAIALIFCLAAHSLAHSMIGFLGEIPASTLPPRLAHNIAGIQFVDANRFVALAYILFFLGALLYMEIRSTPRWAVWVSFLALNLPITAYILLCLRVGLGSFFIAGSSIAP